MERVRARTINHIDGIAHYLRGSTESDPRVFFGPKRAIYWLGLVEIALVEFPRSRSSIGRDPSSRSPCSKKRFSGGDSTGRGGHAEILGGIFGEICLSHTPHTVIDLPPD